MSSQHPFVGIGACLLLALVGFCLIGAAIGSGIAAYDFVIGMLVGG